MGNPTTFTSLAVDNLIVLTASKTLTNADSGANIVRNISTGITITLPAATVAGSMFNISVNKVASAGGGDLSIAPPTGSSIVGFNNTVTAGSTLALRDTADTTGDFITLQSNGSGTWYVVAYNTATAGAWQEV